MSLEVYIGPAAGVATSMLWTATSLLFTAAGRRIGATLVNSLRIALAIVLLGVTHRLLQGMWIPDAVSRQVTFLAISGVVGLTIGDQALFISFMDIGPRLAVLIMTTSPLIAAILGWLVLGESLGWLAGVGILITLGGVAWVVLERPGGNTVRHGPHRRRGIILAFVGAVCQAVGLILSKQGMGHGWLPEDQQVGPQAATLIRMVAAGLGMVPLLAYSTIRDRKRGALPSAQAETGRWRTGLLCASLGAVVGPFLGVWMSLVAVDRADVGVAQTLCSLTPVFLLPCVAILYKERITSRAAVGAIVAVAGSALLFVQIA